MTFQDSLSFSHKPLFYTDAKGISAFRACTAVFTRNTGKTDLYTAIRTFFIYVGFAIFPFVTAQKKPFFDFFRICKRGWFCAISYGIKKRQSAAPSCSPIVVRTVSKRYERRGWFSAISYSIKRGT